MAPKRKAEAAAEPEQPSVYAGVALEEIARQWLNVKNEIKQVTDTVSEKRKVLKTIEEALAERMVAERVESIKIDDETIERTKGITVAK